MFISYLLLCTIHIKQIEYHDISVTLNFIMRPFFADDGLNCLSCCCLSLQNFLSLLPGSTSSVSTEHLEDAAEDYLLVLFDSHFPSHCQSNVLAVCVV